jgi:ATP synthase, F1 delta subunit
MNTGIVASRYAKALLRFAEENQEESRVYQEMLQLHRSFQQVNTLTAALLNPIFSNEKKVELLLTAASLSPECKDASTSTRRFLQLVVEKKRTEMMPFIATSFVHQYEQAKQITRAEVIVAQPITEATEERLRNIVAKRTAGVVNLDVRIDPSLRAGFILQFDDNRMDASLRGKIERLRHQLRLPSRAQ